jgi:hypothetical protein
LIQVEIEEVSNGIELEKESDLGFSRLSEHFPELEVEFAAEPVLGYFNRDQL